MQKKNLKIVEKSIEHVFRVVGRNVLINTTGLKNGLKIKNWRNMIAWDNREFSYSTPRCSRLKAWITRQNVGQWKYKVSIHVWGPDTLAIMVPSQYSWKEVIKGLRHCNYCQADDVDTERVNFAGRCCEECLPEVQKVAEAPGWCD